MITIPLPQFIIPIPPSEIFVIAIPIPIPPSKIVAFPTPWFRLNFIACNPNLTLKRYK